MITVTELPDEVRVDSAFHSVLESYSGHGYEQGYSRATRDVLSVFPLLIEQFLHKRRDATPQVRRALRDFGHFVEDRIARQCEEAGFADGAGI